MFFFLYNPYSMSYFIIITTTSTTTQHIANDLINAYATIEW